MAGTPRNRPKFDPRWNEGYYGTGRSVDKSQKQQRKTGGSLSTSYPLSSRVLPLSPSLKKAQIASSSPISVNFFTSSHRRPHLLTAEGFLKDQIVLILFKF